MSSYYRNTINPRTGKFEPAEWLDDHFGKGLYGVKFRDGEVHDPRKVDMEVVDVAPESRSYGNTS